MDEGLRKFGGGGGGGGGGAVVVLSQGMRFRRGETHREEGNEEMDYFRGAGGEGGGGGGLSIYRVKGM